MKYKFTELIRGQVKIQTKLFLCQNSFYFHTEKRFFSISFLHLNVDYFAVFRHFTQNNIRYY